MSRTDKVVFSRTVTITEEKLSEFLNVINQEIDEDDAEGKLSVLFVMNRPELLDYICRSAIEDGVAIFDPHEFWNNDGWCDWRDFI